MGSAEHSKYHPLKRMSTLLRHYRREIRYIILYALVAGLINLSLPLGIQAIIGLLAGGSISASWGILVLFVIVGAVFTGVLRLMQLSITEHLQRHIFTDAALDFAIRIPRLNLEKLQREYLPELINRFFDTINLQKGLPKVLIEGITATFSILLSITVLSFYHPAFVTFSLILLALLGLMLFLTAPSGLASSLNESKYKYKLAHWLEEIGRVSATFKLTGENNFTLTKADELTASYLDARAKHWRILMIHFISGLAFKVLVLGGFLVLGSLLVMENELNLGQFVASEILIIFITDAVEKLILLHETGYDTLTAVEKLGQVTDLPVESDEGVNINEVKTNGPFMLELKNMNYQFDDANQPTLKNINLTINPGERVAITGYNGAGVSTLMQVICALRTGFSGSVLINNLPVNNLNLRSLRKQIGNLTSREEIFKGTMYENITLGREGIDLQAVLHAADATGIIDFVQSTPDGLNTNLLPNAQTLPGSITTKLLITRAICGNPRLLAVEKPLRNLNLQDRLLIASVITDRQKEWTLVAATEDPVLATLCDRIIVLKDGEIVFDGNYQALRKTPHCDYIFRFNLQQNTN